jgi:transcriptional regulator with XRE-family HTH domain
MDARTSPPSDRHPRADDGQRPAEAGAGSPARQRANRRVLAGRQRADVLAERLGTALREARRQSGATQAACARDSRISQARWSNLERGLGSRAPLETWAVVAATVEMELAAFLDRSAGADLPRDIEHLRRQSAIAARAMAGGWAVAPEARVAATTPGRSIDLLLEREAWREATIVEVWNWLADVGAGFRSLDEKVAAIRRERAGWTVAGAWVLRGTERNRALVRELAALFAARFPGSGRAWLRALDDPAARLPGQPALLWTDSRGTRLWPARPVGLRPSR